MLVLSRKLGERICIGDDIVVTITQINGGRVRVGIEAPRSVDVYRDEIRRFQPKCGSTPTLSKDCETRW